VRNFTSGVAIRNDSNDPTTNSNTNKSFNSTFYRGKTKSSNRRLVLKQAIEEYTGVSATATAGGNDQTGKLRAIIEKKSIVTVKSSRNDNSSNLSMIKTASNFRSRRKILVTD